MRTSLSPQESQLESLKRWSSSSVAFARLVDAIEKRDSILFPAPPVAGKTTLLNNLAGFWLP